MADIKLTDIASGSCPYADGTIFSPETDINEACMAADTISS